MKNRIESKLAGILVLALALGLGLASPVRAEKADRDKPVNIEANSVRVDDISKLAIYEGKVIMTQGSMMMTADRIEVRQDAQGFSSGDARGKQVYFRQKMEGRDEFAEGWADRIEFDGRADKLKLTGKAYLKRGDEELRGNLIIYDGKTEFFQAQGSIDGTPGRVRAVIKPKNPQSGKP